MLIDAPIRRVVRRFVPVSLPSPETFDGQTVFIVGVTTGIGLAVAVHFATLGANIIITHRVSSRGDVARRHIEEAAGPSHRDYGVGFGTLRLMH